MKETNKPKILTLNGKDITDQEEKHQNSIFNKSTLAKLGFDYSLLGNKEYGFSLEQLSPAAKE